MSDIAESTVPQQTSPPITTPASILESSMAVHDTTSRSVQEEGIVLPPDLESGYKKRLVEIGSRLDTLLTEYSNSLHFGPTYLILMPDGKQQEVMTVFYDSPGRGEKDSYRHFDLIALNPNGYPLADRYTDVHYKELEGKKYAMAEGMITTGIRGTGLSTAIELAHMDVLQRAANELEPGYDNGIQLRITNDNLEKIRELQEKFSNTQDASLLPRIDALRLEQQRWQSIYGPNGWLGINTSMAKEFIPNPQGEKLEGSRNVVMAKVDSKPTIQNTTPLAPEDKEAYKESN